LLSLPRGDLPVGRFVDRRVQPFLQKYFALLVGQIISTNSRHPTPEEGRIMIVTDVGHGMRWTRQRLARDGIAGRVDEACERSPSVLTRDVAADGKIVWS
jgi:hypothetical protein